MRWRYSRYRGRQRTTAEQILHPDAKRTTNNFYGRAVEIMATHEPDPVCSLVSRGHGSPRCQNGSNHRARASRIWAKLLDGVFSLKRTAAAATDQHRPSAQPDALLFLHGHKTGNILPLRSCRHRRRWGRSRSCRCCCCWWWGSEQSLPLPPSSVAAFFRRRLRPSKMNLVRKPGETEGEVRTTPGLDRDGKIREISQDVPRHHGRSTV